MKRTVRVPLAWLDAEEAVVFLMGHIPGHKEDKTPHLQRWAKAKATVASRPMFSQAAFTMPLPPELEERAKAFRERKDVLDAVQGLTWDLRWIDLSEVLAFQKQVVLEQIRSRVEHITKDAVDDLFTLAFPDPKEEDLSAAMDYSSKSTTFTSLNPNLNVSYQGAADVVTSYVPGQPAKAMKMFGFIVSIRPSFIQAVQYRGRLYIRDGYHRCFGLLQRGITGVPALVVQASTFQQVGCNGPGFLKEEVLASDRPPFLRDLLDDAVSTSVEQIATRKVIRIKAEEFTIQI